MNEIIYKYNIGGRDMVFIFNKFASQADASVVCRYGDSSVLATASLGNTTNLDYLPFSVEYIERYYAAGKIKSSRFDKRERLPSDEAILTGRLIDRGIRPLIPSHFRQEMQIMITTLSYDDENTLDLIAANAANIVAMISSFPVNGNIASIKIARLNNEFIINPTQTQIEKSDFVLFLTFNQEEVLMIEAQGQEIAEDIILKAINFAKENIKGLINFFIKIKNEIGKPKVLVDEISISIDNVKKELENDCHIKYIEQILYDMKLPKQDRIRKIEEYEASLAEKLNIMYNEYIEVNINSLSIDDLKRLKKEQSYLLDLVHDITKKVLRENILKNKRRIDGRKIDEIRKIHMEVDVIPRMHGSALFQRGETQCLSVLTLGSPGDIQLIDDVNSDEKKKKYIHHYNFPPFATGQVSYKLSTGRREIGHGALAEKALISVLPDDNENPYTMRIVSEILSSNGSSSMAATCGSTLALMAGGIKIKKHVAGISIGLITGNSLSEFEVITDIQDYEDFCGDMDFKVAGTVDGITAIQMDTKLKTGITMDIIQKALQKAKEARLFIIDEMKKVIPFPRQELSPYAPRILTIKVKPEDIRIIIGKGGENINKIIESTGVTIDINDDGTVYITSFDAESAQNAIKMIKDLTFDPNVGDIFEGVITRKLDFGLIVEFAPNKDGMVHISEISHKRVSNLDDFNIGDKIKVKLISKIDGRYNLSIKQV